MDNTALLAAIDAEIERYKQARALLSGDNVRTTMKSGRNPGKKRYSISAEARARMAAGQKARWSKVKAAK
jgi:hypothetical protein